jgi:hypothetical protein
MFASRKFSLPANTSKPCGWKRSSMAAVFFQSPELSFTPAMVFGYAFSSRSISVSGIGTPETGGMWYR